MSPARWQQMEALFHEALLRPTAGRNGWLVSVCGDDRELLQAVREMLAADEDIAGPERIESALADAASAVLETNREEAPTRLGAYQIERELGVGGMGSVFLATRADDQYKKQVAIKMLGRSVAASKGRFLRERQILASLDHPYIARLLDGGAAPDGRPYLILDYVEGEAITDYCQHQRLTVAGRCRLFLKVCEAVVYAHQNLIVHRDLKPANILVTADGTPKLLDFGIAKLIGDEQADAATRTSYGVMTPEYASPEQVQGQTITTATDVYALGAILYELLAGRQAQTFAGYAPQQLIQVICKSEPERPSRVSTQRIPADLDNIVAKAMHKDPRLRYSSAEQLAEDVRRHLSHLPVLARGGSLPYRLRKFVERQWVPVAAIAAIMATLSAGVVVSRKQAAEAERMRQLAIHERDRADGERLRAQSLAAEAMAQRKAAQTSAEEANQHQLHAKRRFEQLRTMIQRFLFDIDKAVEDLPGTSAARRAVASTVLQYLDGMAKEAAEDPVLRHDLAAAYERVAELQGSPGKPSLGDFPAALASYQKALAIRTAAPVASSANRAELMTLHYGIGVVHVALGKRDEAVKSFDRGLALWQPGQKDPALMKAAAGLFYERGMALESTRKTLEAIADLERGERLLREALTMTPDDRKAQADLAMAMTGIGRLECTINRSEQGLARLRNAAQLLEQMNQNVNQVSLRRRWLGTLNVFSENLVYAPKTTPAGVEEALRSAQKAIEIGKELVAWDPSDRIAARDYARSFRYVGRVHVLRQEYEPARAAFQQASDLLEQTGRKFPDDIFAKDDAAVVSLEAGNVTYHLKDFEASRKFFHSGIQVLEGLLARGSNSRFHRFNIAAARRRLGDIELSLESKDKARSEYQAALQVMQQLAAQDPANVMFTREIGRLKARIDEFSGGK